MARSLDRLFLLLSLAIVPSVASAQSPPPGYVYAPAPVYAPPPPHVYVHERVRWHLHRHDAPVVVVQPVPAQAPVWLAPQPPSPPPPPVYIAPPPPPTYAQPQPYYVQPGYGYGYAPPPPPPPVYIEQAPARVEVVNATPPPDFAARFGLGLALEGNFTVENGSNQGYGVLAHIRYRSSRHLGIELQGGYEKSTDSANLTRTDVPLTFGLLVPILGPEAMLTPYLVGTVGVNFADLHILDVPSHNIEDSRTQALAQVGFGLEMRLFPHLSLFADARLERRWNLSDASAAVSNTTSVDGKPVTPVQDDTALRLGVGATMYF